MVIQGLRKQWYKMSLEHTVMSQVKKPSENDRKKSKDKGEPEGIPLTNLRQYSITTNDSEGE